MASIKDKVMELDQGREKIDDESVFRLFILFILSAISFVPWEKREVIAVLIIVYGVLMWQT